MGRIVVTEFVTLDGVMEDPGGAEGSEHGGWARRCERGPEGDRFKLAELLDAEVMLLGRATYEGFAAAWPSIRDEVGFADRMNGIPKYVVSRTLKHAAWANTTVLGGEPAEEVAALRGRLGGNILVAGSATLVDLLADHDLIDELRLMVFPVLLGAGRRLFATAGAARRFAMRESGAAGETLIAVYDRAPA